MRHTLKPTVRATSLAAGLVAALAGLSAHATTTDEMQKIKLYGDVTIAQDSVTSWGPWAQFEAPAAGNPPPSVPTFTSDASNLYRPIGPVTPPTPPAVGSIEGFATFTQSDSSSESLIGSALATVVGSYSLTNVNVSSDPVTTLPAFVSGSFAPHTALGTAGPLLLSNTGTLNLASGGSEYSSANGKIVTHPMSVAGIDSNAIQAWAFIVNYANGDNPTPSAAALQNTSQIYGVVGMRTSDNDMAALRSGNFSATYAGKTLVNNYDVSMAFNFGSGSGRAVISDNTDKAWLFSKFSMNGATATSTTVVAGGNHANGGIQLLFTGNHAAGVIGNVKVVPGNDTPASFALTDSLIGQQTTLTQSTK